MQLPAAAGTTVVTVVTAALEGSALSCFSSSPSPQVREGADAEGPDDVDDDEDVDDDDDAGADEPLLVRPLALPLLLLL